MIAIQQLRQLRRLFGSIVASMDDAALFTAPPGFNNHVGWNVAHVVVTQQLLLYKLSGLEPLLEPEWIDCFRKGTGTVEGTPEAFARVLPHLHSTVDRLEEDYQAGRFGAFQEYETSAGITLANIEEAIEFNSLHEGIHLGYIMAMRKAL